MLAKIIFNCDETGISLKPKEVKFIMPRGSKDAFYTPPTESFHYTTVLACGNAAGDILTPMIIYRNIPDPIPDQFKT